MGFGENLTNPHGGNFGISQSGEQLSALCGRDQQTSGGLGIVQDCAEVLGYLGIVFDGAFRELAVIFQASGDMAFSHTFEGTFEQRDCAG